MMTFENKSEWGPGPWQDEPDELYFTHEPSGYPCMVLRNMTMTGALCGYVGVPPGHPFYGLDNSDEIPLVDGDKVPGPSKMDVFGMMGFMLSQGDKNFVTPGLLLSVHGGARIFGPSSGFIESIRPNTDSWWIGFDCAHSMDLSPRMEAVMKNTPDIPGFESLGDMLASIREKFGDVLRDEYRTIDYVKAEVESLADQLHKLSTRVITKVNTGQTAQ